MENFLEQSNKRDAVIRNYLLDLVDEETEREIDEKIFLEPDFYDFVLLIEQEIIEDLIAGRLSGADKARVEQIYDLPINRKKIEFGTALYKVAENRRRMTPTASLEATQSLIVAEPPPKKRFKWLDWRYLIPATGFIVVITFFTWYLFPDRRASQENELVRLNSEKAAPAGAGKIQQVTLKPDAVRSAEPASTMPKVQTSSAEDEIIGFRLGLINASQEIYEATFSDDQGNEMFSVSDLKKQSDGNGKYVFVLVPSRFFALGDFQINLQGRSGGNLTKAGSFTFRVIRP